MKPTENSILFDLDETLFSMKSTMLKRIGAKYAGVCRFEKVPITQHMFAKSGLMGMHFTMDSII